MEEWRDIKGYEDYYQVSTFGRIKSKKRYWKTMKNIVSNKPKIMVGYAPKNLYRIITLCKNSKCKTKKVHRLVAETFIQNPLKKRTVNHKDGNKLNNRVDNLEWATHSENMKHAFRLGLIPYSKKREDAVINAIMRNMAIPIYQIDIKSNKIIKKWDSINQAKIFLKGSSNIINNVCKNKRDSAYGFKWKYAEKGLVKEVKE